LPSIAADGGGPSGAGTASGSGSVCETSKTFAMRKTVLFSSVSSPASSRALTRIGAQIVRPFSPLRTQRPSFSHARKPAT